MGIFIKNPETERKARELAAMTGESLTGAIDAAIEARIAVEKSKPKRRPTFEEIMAATDEYRRKSGSYGKVFPPVTKEEWDEINEVPGLEDDPA